MGPYPQDYKGHICCPFPPRACWIREDESVSGPFEAVGVVCVMPDGDPEFEHTRHHVLLAGAEGKPSAPVERVVWTRERAVELRQQAEAEARERESAARAAEEVAAARRIAEAEAALEAARSSIH